MSVVHSSGGSPNPIDSTTLAVLLPELKDSRTVTDDTSVQMPVTTGANRSATNPGLMPPCENVLPPARQASSNRWA